MEGMAQTGQSLDHPEGKCIVPTCTVRVRQETLLPAYGTRHVIKETLRRRPLGEFNP
jgi:hypothetical protein